MGKFKKNTPEIPIDKVVKVKQQGPTGLGKPLGHLGDKSGMRTEGKRKGVCGWKRERRLVKL